jgi:hypothetical protein
VDNTLHLTRAIDDRQRFDVAVGINRVGERSDVGSERIRAIGDGEISVVAISRIRQGSDRVGV